MKNIISITEDSYVFINFNLFVLIHDSALPSYVEKGNLLSIWDIMAASRDIFSKDWFIIRSGRKMFFKASLEASDSVG